MTVWMRRTCSSTAAVYRQSSPYVTVHGTYSAYNSGRRGVPSVYDHATDCLYPVTGLVGGMTIQANTHYWCRARYSHILHTGLSYMRTSDTVWRYFAVLIAVTHQTLLPSLPMNSIYLAI